MAMVDFTTYDDIRAALGVSSDDLEDGTISLAVYEVNLKSELRDVSASLATDYATVKAKSSRTDVEQWFFEVTRLFSTYVVAKHLSSSLPMFAPKTHSDGKAEVTRFTDNPYKETVKAVKALYDQNRTRLQAAYADYKATSAPSKVDRVFFATSAPFNPVTNS